MDLDRNQVIALSVAGAPAREAYLDPPLLASFYDENLLERRPATSVRSRRSPCAPSSRPRMPRSSSVQDLVHRHPARSLGEPARLRSPPGGLHRDPAAGEEPLPHERADDESQAARAMLAVMLEWRYSKEQILRKRISTRSSWGRSGSANLIGIGAASSAYCAKEPAS
ncbi:MAG: hypothetical protein R2862_08125 [Thermoanaerobaculia bacterium]